MQARRLRFSAIKQVEWESVDIPEALDPHTVVIKTQKSLISVGTELAIYGGSHIGYMLENPPFQLIPNNPGYALVGEVIAAGDAVEGILIGQRVLAQTSHADVAAVDVRKTCVFPVPDALTNAQGTLLRLAYIALTAVRAAPLQLGESVVVYGQGLVGQLAAQLFLANGASQVIGVDRLAERLAISAQHGIRPLDTSSDDATQTILNWTGGRGADVVVEATGSPMVTSLCLDAVRARGRVVLLGSPRGRVELDLYSQVHRRGIQLLGAHENFQKHDPAVSVRWSKQENLAMLSDLFTTGRLNDEGMIGQVITSNDALAIYDELVDHPQLFLGILIDWR